MTVLIHIPRTPHREKEHWPHELILSKSRPRIYILIIETNYVICSSFSGPGSLCNLLMELASSHFALTTEHTDPKMGPYQVTKHILVKFSMMVKFAESVWEAGIRLLTPQVSGQWSLNHGQYLVSLYNQYLPSHHPSQLGLLCQVQNYQRWPNWFTKEK